MKRFLTLIIALLLLSLVSCIQVPKGDIERQKDAVTEYVEKYYGKAELIDADSLLFDRTTMFTFKDAEYQFEYTVAAMEVEMTDLGFAASDDTTNTTIVMESEFIGNYIAYLMANKVDEDKLNDVLATYQDDDAAIVVREMKTTKLNTFEDSTTEACFIIKQKNTAAASALAGLIAAVDTRDILRQVLIPIYSDRESTTPIGYYDYMFDFIADDATLTGVSALHDYLYNTGMEGRATLLDINTNVQVTDLTVPEGFTWVDVNPCTYIRYSCNGKEYEYCTALGTMEFDTDVDEFGIYEGSFLDIMASERTGAKAVYVGMYAVMYPDEYQHLAIYTRELGDAS